jgi:hypothetical protein
VLTLFCDRYVGHDALVFWNSVPSSGKKPARAEGVRAGAAGLKPGVYSLSTTRPETMVATGPLSRRTPSSQLESGCGQKNLEYGGFILESDEVSIATNRGARPTGGVAFAIDRDENGLRCAASNCSSG